MKSTPPSRRINLIPGVVRTEIIARYGELSPRTPAALGSVRHWIATRCAGCRSLRPKAKSSDQRWVAHHQRSCWPCAPFRPKRRTDLPPLLDTQPTACRGAHRSHEALLSSLLRARARSAFLAACSRRSQTVLEIWHINTDLNRRAAE